MSERDSQIKIKPTMIIIKGFEAIKAIPTTAAPRKREPVSPINIFAG